MAVALTNRPETGQLVTVRSRGRVVSEIQASTLPPPLLKPLAGKPQHLVSLQSVNDDALGEELQVIWEIEPGAKVLEKVELPELTDFDPPHRLDAVRVASPDLWGYSIQDELPPSGSGILLAPPEKPDAFALRLSLMDPRASMMCVGTGFPIASQCLLLRKPITNANVWVTVFVCQVGHDLSNRLVTMSSCNAYVLERHRSPCGFLS